MKSLHHASALLCVGLWACGLAAQPRSAGWPSATWPTRRPAQAGLDAEQLEAAKQYALSAGGSGRITRHGKIVLGWGDQKKRFDIKSATKSFGATMLGVAVKDGKIRLDDPVRDHYTDFGVPPPENTSTGWLDDVLVSHLATQTAGFAKPGGYERLLFPPGTRWQYSDGGPNWLADVITLLYRQDLEQLMFQRVLAPIGITREDLRWRKNQYRDHELGGIPRREFGSGIHANVEALSRLGYLYLRGGRWEDQQILPEAFVKTATRPIPSVVPLEEWTDEWGNASVHYGLLWWNNGDTALPDVPRDAFWAWGLYDSLIVVIPSLDLVVARAGERGRQWRRSEDADHYEVLKPFLNPIIAAVRPFAANDQPRGADIDAAPYPASHRIQGIAWAPTDSIVRAAEGSDNWPLTWADDDRLYTAYGDGWGFEPKVKKKRSLGLAWIQGEPARFRGTNLRSPDAERLGQGPDGEKASGMLMVDGTLYMLVRNANNAQLSWSRDRGATWTKASWKWTTSFGCPTFLNFGKNYQNARDAYVYVYSVDSDSAYQPADQMVLARVPKAEVRVREAYQFFAGADAAGNPQWTTDIDGRRPVFRNPGNCYRSGISYNAGLQRYLWCQTLPQSRDPRGPRFQGGFGIFAAPEPWGPWRTVYYTHDWDVGPGETSSFPTKWIASDGRTAHLVFSGDDHFSVRRARLLTAQD